MPRRCMYAKVMKTEVEDAYARDLSVKDVYVKDLSVEDAYSKAVENAVDEEESHTDVVTAPELTLDAIEEDLRGGRR